MDFLDSFLTWWLAANLRAFLLGFSILAIQFFLSKTFHLPARWRYAFWFPVVCVLAAPKLPPSDFSIENRIPILRSDWIRRFSLQTLAQTPTSNPVPAPAPPSSPSDAQNPSETRPSLTPISADSNVPLWSLRHWLSAGLLAGAFLQLFRSVFSYHHTLSRIRKESHPIDIELLNLLEETTRLCGLKRIPFTLVSSAIRSPAVTGFLKPTVLLPAGFPSQYTPEEARFVLLHELTHIKRRDLLANWILCCLQALHWLNPFIGLYFARIRADRELACDAHVLSQIPANLHASYGLALLRFERSLDPVGLSRCLVGIFERASGIRLRIAAIANYRKAHPFWTFAGSSLLCLTLLTGASHLSIPTTDFQYEIWHVHHPDADRFLVENKGVRKYGEWQAQQVSYWGPAENSTECHLTYCFPFPVSPREISVYAQLAAFNFSHGGGIGRGLCSLWASSNGIQWQPLLENPTPESIDSYRTFDGALPPALSHIQTLWIQVRFRAEGAPNRLYTTAQFCRSTPQSEKPAFSISARF